MLFHSLLMLALFRQRREPFSHAVAEGVFLLGEIETVLD